MDQEQVDVVEAQRLQGAVERSPRIVGLVGGVAQLAGDEHLAAVQAGGPDALADALLVAVHLGGVDVPVAHVQSLADRLGRLGRVDLEHPEAELRDGLAVVQGEVGNLGHAAGCLLRRRKLMSGL